jgi:transposase-like protein
VFWDEFLRTLANRDLRGVKLIIANAHKGLKGAAAIVLGGTIQRCSVHFMRNAPTYVGKKDRPVVTAALRTTSDQDRLAASNEHSTNPLERLKEEIKRRRQLQGYHHGPGENRCP